MTKKLLLAKILLFSLPLFSLKGATRIRKLEEQVAKLEERLRNVEDKLTIRGRKPTCPETCNCGPNCSCSSCSCGQPAESKEAERVVQKPSELNKKVRSKTS